MGKPFNKQYRGRGGSSYRGRGRGRGGASGAATILETEKDGTRDSDKAEDSKQSDALDEKLGFPKYQEGPPKVGWLVNMQQVIPFPRSSRDLIAQYLVASLQTLVTGEGTASGQAAVDFYFIQEDGGMFKSTICYEPYFYIACRVSRVPSSSLTHLLMHARP